MSKPITEFTVKRSRWLRGKPGQGALCNEEWKMCCLGFLGVACGIKAKDLFNEGEPSDTLYRGVAETDQWPDGFFTDDNQETSPVKDIMACNDSDKLSDQEREEELREAFAGFGITVKFED